MGTLKNGMFRIENFNKGDNSIIARDTTLTGRYSDTDSDDILIAYSDSIESFESVQTCIDMFNNGVDLMAIDDFLLNDIDCTQDDRELIIEGIGDYIEIFEQQPNI